jgi:putative ABC transport system substrate-binding protein
VAGVARAQQDNVWRVGYLNPSSATKLSVALFDAFKIKLQELGDVEGKNLALDVRRADDDYTRLPALAAALVSLAPNVIVGVAAPATAALQQATSSIPIIMAGTGDPIALGFVNLWQSLVAILLGCLI